MSINIFLTIKNFHTPDIIIVINAEEKHIYSLIVWWLWNRIHGISFSVCLNETTVKMNYWIELKILEIKSVHKIDLLIKLKYQHLGEKIS